MVSCQNYRWLSQTVIEAKHCRTVFGFLIQTPAFLTVHQTPNLLLGKLCLDTDNWMSNQMSDPNTNCWLPIGNARFLVYLWGSISKGQPHGCSRNIWQNIEAAPDHEASVVKLLNPMVNSSELVGNGVRGNAASQIDLYAGDIYNLQSC